MGYYVSTIEAEFFLSKVNFDDAYKAMCALNDRDDLKRGGSYGGGGIDARSDRPAGLNYHPHKWFSWLDPDYPDKLKTTPDILQQIGFDLHYDDNGNIVYLQYDNKMGQEDLFLEAIAPFVKRNSYIIWRGEDGEHWKDIFINNRIVRKAGYLTFD